MSKREIKTPPPQEGGMTPQRIKSIRLACGMTLKQASEHIGVGLRSWQAWEQSEGISRKNPSKMAIKSLEAMERMARSKEIGPDA